MAERSFFFRGIQFPVCARCTGVFFASIAAVIMFFVYRVSIFYCFVLSSIMLIDWLLQFKEILPSTNPRRLVTGLLGGYGVMTLQMYLYAIIFDGILSLLSL